MFAHFPGKFRRKIDDGFPFDVKFNDGSRPYPTMCTAMVYSNRFISGSPRIFRRAGVWALLLASSSVSDMLGCSSSTNNGGSTELGGGVSTGGAPGGGDTSANPTGGAAALVGGQPGTGGAAVGGNAAGGAATGGKANVGGGPATGGTPAGGAGAGGAATGGTPAGGNAAGGSTNVGPTGGKTTSGGSSSPGGAAATGGKSAVGGASAGGNGATGGATGAATGGQGAGGGVSQRPCDIYGTATPCAAAYSTVRSLSSTYKGPLYQIRVGSSATNTGTGGTLQDVNQTSDGYADVTTVDASCSATTICTVSKLYDQSGNGNDLIRATAGPAGNGSRTNYDDYEAVITKVSMTAGGHKVYPLYIQVYGGYRSALGVKQKNVPSGNTPQGMYELVDGTHYGKACCWDFGNVSPDPNKYATMNTIFFGTGYWGKGAGNGPWFEDDFEGGVWAGGAAKGDPGASDGAVANTSNPSITATFAFATIKTTSGKYAIRVADASTATDLTTAYNGNSPSNNQNAGGVVLGVGGDNSNNSEGTFIEGAIVAGQPADATDKLILQNVQAVGYKKP